MQTQAQVRQSYGQMRRISRRRREGVRGLGAGLLVGIGSGVLGLVLGTGAVAGQTRFSWPDTTLNFARYTSYEECWAAANRLYFQMRLQEAASTGIWWDTMPYNGKTLDAEFDIHRDNVLVSPAHQAAHQAAARRCVARFPLDSVPAKLDMTMGLKQLPSVFGRRFKGSEPFFTYGTLLADARDSTMLLAYLDRRLQGASPEEITRTLISAAHLVRDFRTPPANHRLYTQIVERYAPRLPDRVQRAHFYGLLLLDDVYARQDTAAALGVARRLAKFLADSLTPEQRDSFFTVKAGWLAKSDARVGLRGRSYNEWITDAIRRDTRPWPERTLADWLHHFTDLSFDRDEGLDSLRKSTDAYLNFYAAKNFRDFKGFAQMDSATKAIWNYYGLGRKVPPLKAVAWAGPKVTGPRPTPGKVSVVLFMSPRYLCGEGGGIDNAEELAGNCVQHLVPLRRLVDSFPELEVTVVTRALGYFRNTSDSITPAKEAALLYQMLAGMKITTVPVAIADPGHRSLPEPDGRPVENAANDSNAVAYSTSPLLDPKPEVGVAGVAGMYGGKIELIDPDGRIVYDGGMAERQSWHDLAVRVRVLLDRKRTP